MSQFNDTGYGTVDLTATVAMYERVTRAGALAGIGDTDVGVAREQGVSGDTIGVSLITKQGTQKMVAAGAITAGAKVYTAASGRISATQGAGAFLRGIAWEAASAAADVIEVLPVVGDTPGV